MPVPNRRGSAVHFDMIMLRFRPDCFRARSRLGYGTDWPIEWNDLAMVGRIALGHSGKVSGLGYCREGPWRRQRARNVVVGRNVVVRSTG